MSLSNRTRRRAFAVTLAALAIAGGTILWHQDRRIDRLDRRVLDLQAAQDLASERALDEAARTDQLEARLQPLDGKVAPCRSYYGC